MQFTHSWPFRIPTYVPASTHPTLNVTNIAELLQFSLDVAPPSIREMRKEPLCACKVSLE